MMNLALLCLKPNFKANYSTKVVRCVLIVKQYDECQFQANLTQHVCCQTLINRIGFDFKRTNLMHDYKAINKCLLVIIIIPI